jgi:hypothetical protein
MTGAIAVVTASLGQARAAVATDGWNNAVVQTSRFGVSETVQRIGASAQRRGLRLFACIEQPLGPNPGAAQLSALVLVLESTQGGTPVLMRGEGPSSQTDVPFSIRVQPAPGGSSEVVIPSRLDFAEGWRELPQDVVAELAVLPAVVADALG